ncbi:MAG: RNA polymerase sigma factor [bacterium]|nr:RNA polymerase sigma factor [bacterium]
MAVAGPSVLDVLAEMESDIRRVARSKTREIRHRIDEDDILQVVYFSVWHNAEQCRAESRQKQEAWIMTIATNAIRTEISKHALTRKRSTRREVGTVNPTSHASQCLDVESDPDYKAIIRENHDHVASCVDRLKPSRQEVIRLRMYESLPYQEVARQMGCSVLAARKLYSRAMADLKRELAQKSLFGF